MCAKLKKVHVWCILSQIYNLKHFLILHDLGNVWHMKVLMPAVVHIFLVLFYSIPSNLSP